MLSLCRFLAHYPEVLAAELVERAARCCIFGGATGASSWGVLWSLDPVLTPAKVSGEGGGGGGAGKQR